MNIEIIVEWKSQKVESREDAIKYFQDLVKEETKEDRIKILEDANEVYDYQLQEVSEENWKQLQKTFQMLAFFWVFLWFLIEKDIFEKTSLCIQIIFLVYLAVFCLLTFLNFLSKKTSTQIEFKNLLDYEKYESFMIQKLDIRWNAVKNLWELLLKRSRINNILLWMILLMLIAYFILIIVQ